MHAFISLEFAAKTEAHNIQYFAFYFYIVAGRIGKQWIYIMCQLKLYRYSCVQHKIAGRRERGIYWLFVSAYK